MSRIKQCARKGKGKKRELSRGDLAEDRSEQLKKGKKNGPLPGQSGSSQAAFGENFLIEKLLDGLSMEEFTNEYFEKKPLLVRGTNAKHLFEPGLFSRYKLMGVISQQKLEHNKDLQVCRYVDKTRDNYCPSSDDMIATKDVVAKLLDQGYSCQFYQPQRYVDGLFKLNAAFESTFGCLAGASAYLTPPAAQALAPHYDDVEVFVLQTEGRKKWKLYKPMVELAGEHSLDLDETAIGDVWREITLEEGDLLYFPRGVIHQACTDEHQFSTHVTISIYQHNTWANFLEVALPWVIRRAFDSDVDFRRGLPIQYLNWMGSQFASDTERAKSFNQEFRALVGKLGWFVDSTDLQHAADAASLDFVANRLPPARVGKPLTTELLLYNTTQVRFRNRSHIRLVMGEDETNGQVVSVYHSTRNCRVHHMSLCSCLTDDDDEEENVESDAADIEDDENFGGTSLQVPPQPQSIVFASTLIPSLMKLYTAYPQYISIAELDELTEDETELRGMLLRLWSELLIESRD